MMPDLTKLWPCAGCIEIGNRDVVPFGIPRSPATACSTDKAQKRLPESGFRLSRQHVA